MTPNQSAFLSVVGWSEGTIQIPNSDNGYKVLVGSTPDHPLLFDSYETHPNIYNAEFDSTAAGKFQINCPTWKWYCASTCRPTLAPADFTPETQDAIALWLIDKHGATQDVIDGNLQSAVAKCASVWASFVGSPYRQHQNSYNQLVAAYTSFGGTINS